MKKISLLSIILCFVVLFSGCEKGITFKLDQQDPKLVVEGFIETGQPPVVYLSKSLNFFSRIDPGILENSFIHNAEVFVSNGTLTHKLKEYNVPVGGGYSFYYYSVDPSVPGTSFLGELNTRYALKVKWDGKEYTALTVIPEITRRIDSLFWRPAGGNNSPNKIEVMVRATDPPGYGDYIRYFTKETVSHFIPG